MHMIAKLISFLSGGQTDFLIPLSHQWHGVNVAPALDLVAFGAALITVGLLVNCIWCALRRRPFGIAFILMLATATAAYAASSTLGNLSSGSAISATDLFYDVQSVGTGGVKVTGTQLQTWAGTVVQTGPGATGGTCNPGATCIIQTQLKVSANSPSSSGGYSMQATDEATNLVLESGYSGTLTIPVATTTGFTNGNAFTVSNESGLNVAVAVTTSTLGGFSAFNLGPGARISFNSDGSNYHWTGGMGAVSFQTGSSTGNSLTPYNGYFVCTAACTVTPPVPAPGYQFCVMNDDNVSSIITLGAISGVQYENTARTSYKTANTSIASAGAAGDMLCIVGRDSTHYLSPTYVGTWAWLLRDLVPYANGNTPAWLDQVG